MNKKLNVFILVLITFNFSRYFTYVTIQGSKEPYDLSMLILNGIGMILGVYVVFFKEHRNKK
ncbi:hypothetical protein [Metabacillus iocasae]|uniref:Glycopeptide antibiotics resistance protein n=1 Tax=Priestia iocasae TaxID=2291674 RepID=A0ABS2QVL0_9BACI|nr:hypothetical protein [Metabacillus iocasae]MBM7703499.1 glycopeptide antibiotics resistance protein [Metabacillus iocasae]